MIIISTIVDVNTKKYLKALPSVCSKKNVFGDHYFDTNCLEKYLDEFLNHKNDIFFLIKVKKDGVTNNWEIYQIVSDAKEKVINYLEENYDDYEFIFSCSINKVYRV